jgi:hypothetical protein
MRLRWGRILDRAWLALAGAAAVALALHGGARTGRRVWPAGAEGAVLAAQAAGPDEAARPSGPGAACRAAAASR